MLLQLLDLNSFLNLVGTFVPGFACGVVALFLPVETMGQNLTDGPGSAPKLKPDKKGLVDDMEDNENAPPPNSEQRF